VLWSPVWYALDEPSYETDGVDDGMVVSFNQDGMDDVAEVMEAIVASLDFGSAIEPTEFDCLLGSPCKLYVSSAKVQPQEGGGPAAEMELDLIDGGIAVELDLYNFRLITALDIPNPVGSLIPIPGLSETLTADIGLTWEHIQLNMNFYISMVDGEAVANAEPLETQLDMGPAPTIEVIDGVQELDSVLDGVLAITVPIVHAAVEVALPFVAGDLMQDLVGGLTDSFLVDELFEIPGLVETAPANFVHFKTQSKQLQCTEEQMRLAFQGLAFTSDPQPPYEVPGSPMFAGCGPAGTIPPSVVHPLLGGLHDDFLNQLLFAMWEGGSITYDLEGEEAAAIDTGDIGANLSRLKIDPMLPLMLNSCHGSDILQIGELFVEAELEFLGEPTHLSMWMQLQAELAFATEEGEDGSHKIVFDVVNFEPFLIEVLQNEGLFEGDDIGLAELLSDTFLPLLLDGVAEDALAFEIPVIELGDMSDEIEEGTGIRIDIEEMDRSGAYLTFGGQLEAVSAESEAP
ncbi:MAG: hypothetical protein VX938_12065, partial [Myxococcota bacterium]|nr:hypothetical protein [Myxococcota bacterium]